MSATEAPEGLSLAKESDAETAVAEINDRDQAVRSRELMGRFD